MYVGSHECDFPEKYGQLPQLTSSTITFTTSADVDKQVREHLNKGQGLYSVDSMTLSKLCPDVIVTQSLCKVCSVDFCLVEKLALGMEPQPTVVDTNPQDLFEVLRDVERVGSAIGLEEASRRVRSALECRIDRVLQYVAKRENRPTVAMMEWTDPIFIGGHWTPQIIHMAGGVHPLNLPKDNVHMHETRDSWVGTGAGPSFTISPERLVECDPDIIIIAPCGLNMSSTIQETKPLLETTWWKRLKAVHRGDVWLVDGNHMFNRPGPRLVDALEWVCWVLHGMESPGRFEFPAMKLDDIIV